MKAIMISIQPKHVANILNGIKKLEIRKSTPKCELPIDVYIYCTKGKPYLGYYDFSIEYSLFNNKKELEKYKATVSPRESMLVLQQNKVITNGKVVAKFTLNKVDSWKGDFREDEYLTRIGCISWEDLHKYFKGGQTRYAWHIDNLTVFDKPKSLSEFNHITCSNCTTNFIRPLKRAPQSWCYIEVNE